MSDVRKALALRLHIEVLATRAACDKSLSIPARDRHRKTTIDAAIHPEDRDVLLTSSLANETIDRRDGQVAPAAIGRHSHGDESDSMKATLSVVLAALRLLCASQGRCGVNRRLLKNILLQRADHRNVQGCVSVGVVPRDEDVTGPLGIGHSISYGAVDGDSVACVPYEARKVVDEGVVASLALAASLASRNRMKPIQVQHRLVATGALGAGAVAPAEDEPHMVPELKARQAQEALRLDREGVERMRAAERRHSGRRHCRRQIGSR